MTLFLPATIPARDSNGNTAASAVWSFYREDTTTPQSVEGGAETVTANSSGVFAEIQLTDSVDYRAILTDSSGRKLLDITSAAETLFAPGTEQAQSGGAIVPGAFWRFYTTTTTTPEAVYADPNLVTSLGSFVEADAAAVFPAIYLDSNVTYKAVLEKPDGTVLATIDPVTTASMTNYLYPSLSIAATSADKDEGNSGTTNFTFTVTRTGREDTACSADWAVTGSGNDPANAADFGGALPSGTVSFAASETTQVITVQVSGDTDSEWDEGFTVTLSNATNCSLGTTTATGTIREDDEPLASIAADGWQATVSSPTDLSLTPVTVRRAGYDNTGAATTTDDTLYLTKRVRQPYPNEGSFTTDQVALSEYVYADDVIAGATNNSTEDSPKPICRWVMPDRYVVGDSFHWEIAAFHLHARSGNPVACVHVRATNGTNSTAWQVVTAPTVSTAIEDAQDTAVYQGDLDTSGLPDGLYYLEAKVYPHVGVAASVMESSSSTSIRAFGRRFFTKNSTTAATPPYVYVASTGNDGTGVCSTTAATAAASPCLTITGALAKAAATLTDGLIDGLIIRVVDTVALGASSAANLNQSSGAVIVTRDPGTARASAIVQQSAACNFKLGLGGNLDASLPYGCIIFKDVTFQRTASGQFANGGTPGAQVQLWNASVDNGSVVGAWGGTGSAIAHYGAVWTNVSTTTFTYNANQVQYTLRGVTATINGYEGGCMVGCQFTGIGGPSFADAQEGAMWYNNAMLSPSNSTACIAIASASSGQTITGVAVVQNFIEVTHTTSGTPTFRPSSDSANGNITHMVCHHNVSLGAYILGRWNVCYDEAAVARFHKFISMKGNVAPQINVKGDVHYTDGTRLGNRALIHGVACRGNFTKYQVSSVSTEAQAYAGIDSDIGTSISTLNDPVFVSDAGTTFTSPSTYNAGAGGSDVHPDTGSPLIGMVTELLLSHDFAGTARSGTQDAGIYA